MASSPWPRTAGAAPVPPPEAAAAAATAAATPAPTSEQHRVKVPPQPHFLFSPTVDGSFSLALQVQAELLTGACRRKETLPPRLYRSRRRRRPSPTCRGTMTRNCDPPCHASLLCYRNACSVLAWFSIETLLHLRLYCFMRAPVGLYGIREHAVVYLYSRRR